MVKRVKAIGRSDSGAVSDGKDKEKGNGPNNQTEAQLDKDAKAVSKEKNQDKEKVQTSRQVAAQLNKEAINEGGGNAPITSIGHGSDAVRARTKSDILAICNRFHKENRWGIVEPIKNEILREAKKRGMAKEQAQLFAYSEIDRMYPPLTAEETPPPSPTSAPTPNGGRIIGLGDIPDGWGDLPGNAGLQAELSWVQAQRLRVVEETSTGATKIHLDKASEPAPSMSALSWLETSVRNYAKFVDVVSRVLTGTSDEQEDGKREKGQLDEILAILREMQAP